MKDYNIPLFYHLNIQVIFFFNFFYLFLDRNLFSFVLNFIENILFLNWFCHEIYSLFWSLKADLYKTLLPGLSTNSGHWQVFLGTYCPFYYLISLSTFNPLAKFLPCLGFSEFLNILFWESDFQKCWNDWIYFNCRWHNFEQVFSTVIKVKVYR